MKKYFFIFIILTCLFLFGCQNTSDIELNSYNDNIVLIKSYVNFAWGSKYYGEFITEHGMVYKFDFSDNSNSKTIEDVLECDRFFGIKKYSKYKMKEIVKLIDKIPNDINFEEKQCAFDSGQTTYYIVKNNKVIKIGSKGDILYKPKNNDALALLNILDINLD